MRNFWLLKALRRRVGRGEWSANRKLGSKRVPVLLANMYTKRRSSIRLFAPADVSDSDGNNSDNQIEAWFQ